MLHLVFKSPFQSNGLSECLLMVNDDDDILLLEDAVVAAVAETETCISLPFKKKCVYVLQEDAEARGLIQHLTNEIKLIDMKGFVELTEKHITQISW